MNSHPYSNAADTEETEVQGHYVNTHPHRNLFVLSSVLQLQILYSLAAVYLLHRAGEM